MNYDFFYDKKVSKIGGSIAAGAVRLFAREIVKAAGVKKRTLEIGPGKGQFLGEMRKAGHSCTVVEPNASLADHIRKNFPGTTVLRKEIPPLRIKGKKFDLIYAGGVIEHLADHKEALRVFSDVHALLGPGGIFAFFVPDCLVWKEDFYNTDYSHRFFTTELRMRNLLKDSGFVVLRRIYARGFFTGLPRILLTPFFWLFHQFFVFLFWLTGKEVFQKARITFLPNILIIAGKK
jgi:SAM-dependent methyltransferase